jgi:chromosome segregation ATPase
MSDLTDILVPEPEGVAALLARIETDLANIKEDTRHIKVRLTSLDANMSSLNRHMGHCVDRLERIERRIDVIKV